MGCTESSASNTVADHSQGKQTTSAEQQRHVPATRNSSGDLPAFENPLREARKSTEGEAGGHLVVSSAPPSAASSASSSQLLDFLYPTAQRTKLNHDPRSWVQVSQRYGAEDHEAQNRCEEEDTDAVPMIQIPHAASNTAFASLSPAKSSILVVAVSPSGIFEFSFDGSGDDIFVAVPQAAADEDPARSGKGVP